MLSTDSKFDIERSIERISEALEDIVFPDYSSVRLLLNEFTQIIARHYDFFNHVILKNIARIEINLKACNEEKDRSKSFKSWQKTMIEFNKALSLIKESAVE